MILKGFLSAKERFAQPMSESLNDDESGDCAEAVDATCAASLLDEARQAKAAAISDPSRSRGEFVETVRRLDRAAGRVRHLDLDGCLTDRNISLAFWINLYNAMVIHGALRLGVRHRMTEVRGFFRRTQYTIGDERFNLDVIEHGILRANRGHPLRFGISQLLPGDRRRRLIIRPMDLRIHFALNCGALSCPPIRHYDAANIDEQLALAAQSFVSQAITISDDHKEVALSRIFLWYARDFGWTKRSQLASAARFLDSQQRQDVLKNPHLKIRYADYDWSFA